MCVITYKPTKTNITKKDLKLMFKQNPDGIGLAYKSESKKSYDFAKFLDFKEFYKFYRENKINSKEAVIHFRLATHGSVTMSNCHPFPVATTINKQQFGTANKLLFHNGVMSELGSKRVSDSLFLANRILSHLDSKASEKLLNELSESYQRYALLDNTGILLFGDYSKYKGLQCSNLRFLPASKQPKTKYLSNWYEDEEDEYYNNYPVGKTTVNTTKKDLDEQLEATQDIELAEIEEDTNIASIMDLSKGEQILMNQEIDLDSLEFQEETGLYYDRMTGISITADEAIEIQEASK